jgi:hypothetical protein
MSFSVDILTFFALETFWATFSDIGHFFTNLPEILKSSCHPDAVAYTVIINITGNTEHNKNWLMVNHFFCLTQ